MKTLIASIFQPFLSLSSAVSRQLFTVSRMPLAVCLLLALSTLPSALCQIPQGFNYQAVAKDGSGNPIAGQTLPVRISIQSDSLGGTIFWVELHSNVTTNSSGLFTLVVGKGEKQSGTATTFSAIDWSVWPKYIQTEVDYGGWKILGSSKFWSVPYAEISGTVKQPMEKLTVKGITTNKEEALFEVKNQSGKTVFAVYSEGVRVFVDDGNKAVKGGFAVSSMADTKTEPQNFLYVGKDSIRAYVYDDPLNKAVKGGFAVSGFSNAKNQTNDYLLVGPDSVRVFIDKAPSDKAVKGGFAVSGFGNAKGADEEYLRVTRDSTKIIVNQEDGKVPKGGFSVSGFGGIKGTETPFTKLTLDNYLIGQEAGKSLTTGKYNSFLGYQAGILNTGGSSNSLMGYQAGYSNTIGNGNLLLGYKAGYSNTTGDYNTFLGYLAGNKNASGLGNTFVGSYTGQLNQTGNNNTFMGFNAGGSNTSGSHNIFLGTEAGLTNATGDYNCFMGYHAGLLNVGGAYNVFLGYEAGNDNLGNDNTFLGSRAGRSNTTGNYNLFIGREAGWANTTGSSNTYLGLYAGREALEGMWNVFIGTFAGQRNTKWQNVFLGFNSGTNSNTAASVAIGFSAGENMTWDMNTCIGTLAGQNVTGQNNVIIGSLAGQNVTSHDNVIIGQQAGMIAKRSNIIIGNYAAKTRYANYRLFVDVMDRDSSQTFIWGDFQNQILTFNARVGIGTCTPGCKFQVGKAGDGSEARANAWNLLSDMRYKTDIEELSDPMKLISGINGFYFHWNTGTDSDRQFGLSAQDVQKVLPEVVSEGTDGYLSVDYGKLVPLLIEGMKEQQNQIETQNDKIDRLERMILDMQRTIASSR